MCKFRDENSPGWNVLAGCLYDFVKQAPSAIERNWAQEQRRNLQATHDFVTNMIHSKLKRVFGGRAIVVNPRLRHRRAAAIPSSIKFKGIVF